MTTDGATRVHALLGMHRSGTSWLAGSLQERGLPFGDVNESARYNAKGTRENEALHRRVHEAFAHGWEWAGIGGFVEWMYAELFQMPLGDPALGLDVPDPFARV